VSRTKDIPRAGTEARSVRARDVLLALLDLLHLLAERGLEKADLALEARRGVVERGRRLLARRRLDLDENVILERVRVLLAREADGGVAQHLPAIDWMGASRGTLQRIAEWRG
jgi:hypothetical protein